MTKKYVYNYQLQDKNGTLVPVSDFDWGFKSLPFHELSAFVKATLRNMPAIQANKITIEYFYDENNVECGQYFWAEDDVVVIPWPTKYIEMMLADPKIVKQSERHEIDI